MFTSILFATLFTAVSALQVDPHANSSSSLDSDNGSRLRARGQESICGADDAIEAKCAKTNEFGSSYYHSKAVLRISRNGNMLCTGWLVGDQGHIITAYHCLNDAKAATFTFEAMAEGATCATNCRQIMACPGRKIHANPVQFVATGGSKENDWTILKLSEKDNQDARKMGLPFFKIRKSGAKEGERIYTAGHPNGNGKRIGFHAPGGFATILSTFARASVDRVTYNVDTNGGASGSPVLSFRDNVVVALATNGGCAENERNSGLSGRWLFKQAENILPASAWVN